jgi:hypothetical protein
MEPKVIGATAAVRNLGELLARVRYRGESFLIRRGNTIVACLGPPPFAGASGRELAARWRARAALGVVEGKSFGRDVASGRRRLNQPPKSPWPR